MHRLKRMWRRTFGTAVGRPGKKRIAPENIRQRNSFLLLLTAAVLVASAISLYVKITPLVGEMATSAAANVVTLAINKAVTDRMASGDLDYSKIIKLEKDQNGSISALITDMASINRLKAELSRDIIEAISDAKDAKIGIPAGNLFGVNLLSGKGPKINIEILTVSSVSTNFSNRFSSAGINQTRHQIMIDVDVTVSVLAPGNTLYTDISTQLTAAETVIVGGVPNSYLHFENGELKVDGNS